ncbi:GntR family transcriptional regulator [Thiomicrorhabdus heinhorstiae]|uniref:GntR family transcriptional regulator n=1 Tax=Thiomicrorhabdus heinhorstiae TaxID=2748010 RepID=A0ABS0BZL3_9GAMM|nr:GntR family transcriptional regulator [Thiomicrorhabdus heinhorstiae]MBF6058490.1 GntR family transcriptional regulator [Thiomicrorhabdus heinhorstiae]
MEKSKSSRNQEQVIYDRLFDVILEQKLQPGARLTEEPLAEIFGVSRTIIRRVLLRLSHEGVVEIKPNVGASVVMTSPEEVAQFFEARKVVEGALASMITGKLTPYQVEMLYSMVREESRLFEMGNRAKGLRKSTEFHFYLVEAAGNQPLAEMAKKLIARTSLIVSQYNLSGSGGCACNDHSALVEVIVNGQPDEAESLMREHIDHIQHGLFLKDKSVETDLYALLKPE